MKSIKTTKKIILMAVIVSLCSVLSYLDTQVSTIVTFGTGIKLGIANILILACLSRFKFKDLLLIGFLKSLLTGLLLGTVSTFLISLSGTILSIIVMTILYKSFSKHLSLITISLFGGIAHTTGQILVVSFYNKIPLNNLLPFVISISVATIISSILVGFVAIAVNKYIDKTNVFKEV